MFGKLLGSVVKIVNAPIRAVENIAGAETEDDRILSVPGNELGKELDKVDEDED